jgi:hypothetical protein
MSDPTKDTTPAVGPTNPATNEFKAMVRSLMPFILGGIVAACAHFGWHPTGVQTADIVGVLGVFLTIVVRLLEAKWPAFGVLLGYIGAPVYPPSTKVSLQAQLDEALAKLAALTATVEENAAASKASDAPPAPPNSVVAPSA